MYFTVCFDKVVIILLYCEFCFNSSGWIGKDINYSVQSSSSQDLSSSTHNETLIPQDELNQWFLYDNENIIQQLLQSLNDRGIREHNLIVNLKKIMPFIHIEFEQSKKLKNSLEQQDENIELSHDIISSFKAELEDIETRLRLGTLGGFTTDDNLNEWQIKLKQSIERYDLAELLIQLQQTVIEKYTTGIFNLSDKKSLQIWMNDCRTCKTYSRLYVLMLIFENCITWNKSTLDIKCKICRKKHKDEYIIVCDQCCYGFHQECLRGYSETLTNSTNDLWFCPACRPSTSKRRTKQDKNYYENNIYNDDDDDDDDDDNENQMEVETTSSSTSHNNEHLSDSNADESDHTNEDENRCRICGIEENLIQCRQCRQYYHCQCHEPPLRCPPRSTTWMCNHCRNGSINEINYAARQMKIKNTMKKSQEKNPIQQQRRGKISMKSIRYNQ